MRVHQVVAAAPDQPGQPRQGLQVPVAAHPQMGDPHPVGGQTGGHRARVGQGHHVAARREVPQQQPQLLFRAADAEAGDDVQDPHAASSARP